MGNEDFCDWKPPRLCAIVGEIGKRNSTHALSLTDSAHSPTD
jgi:hypothetical protein